MDKHIFVQHIMEVYLKVSNVIKLFMINLFVLQIGSVQSQSGKFFTFFIFPISQCTYTALLEKANARSVALIERLLLWLLNCSL